MQLHLKTAALLYLTLGSLLSSASVSASAQREESPPSAAEAGTKNPTPDFQSIKDISIRKQAFIRHIANQARPLLHKLEKERTILLSHYLRYRSGDPLSAEEQQWVLGIAKSRNLTKFDSDDEATWVALIKRTDVVPLSLLIAQGAIESAWGTSRFAREGNNYFGIWCSRPGCGMVPTQRAEGATHEVESYPTTQAAIEKYLLILNTRSAFEEFRKLRYQQRINLLTPSGTFVLNGLGLYAKNGEEYMALLEKIIHQNQLAQYD